MGLTGRFAVCFILAFAAAVLVPDARAEVPGTYGDVYRWYLRAAHAGDPKAQLLLGIRYEDGIGFPRDDALAADWYERAAKQGLAEAQFKLALLLANGRGRPRDLAAAEDWYRKAAMQGYGPAQYNLGVLLLETASNEEEHAQALAWILRAERAGVAPAAALAARIREAWPHALVTRAQSDAEAALSPDTH